MPINVVVVVETLVGKHSRLKLAPNQMSLDGEPLILYVRIISKRKVGRRQISSESGSDTIYPRSELF